MNKQRIITQVTKAISTYPSIINLKRTIKNNDGLGGYTATESDVATFDGFIDVSGSSLAIVIGDGGTVSRVKKISLILAYNESFTVEIGDYFNANGTDYKVVYPNNLFDVCYICELEVIN